MRILDFNPAEGFAFQGDLIIMPYSGPLSSKRRMIHSGSFTLLEGEGSGHHHMVVVDQIDADKASLEKAFLIEAKPSAELFQDVVAQNCVDDPDLCIGFLVVTGAPVLIVHQKDGRPTEEHDAVRLRIGSYYIGRQREFDGEYIRRVMD
jgi:hypothetical protein